MNADEPDANNAPDEPQELSTSRFAAAPDLGLSGGDRRRELIERLEEMRGARVLVYMDASTSPAGPKTGALRYLFEHLRGLPGRPHNRIVLVCFHNGPRGDDPESLHLHLDHALRCMTLIREFTREVEVIIPSSAFGVGTFLAIGADNLLMHPLGTLGNLKAARGLAVARHFLGLLREAGIDPKHVEQRGLEKLLDSATPTQLGLSRYLIERLLFTVRELVERRVHRRQDAQNKALFDALIDEACPLAHPIDRRRAKDMLSLPVESMDNELETVLGALFSSYERALDIGEGATGAGPLSAVIESTTMCHAAPCSDDPNQGWLRSMETELH